MVAPPYDVLSTEEARAMARGRPWSFLHISKPEIDLAPGIDPHAPEVYAKGAENMAAMVKAGVLRRDETPGYYVYRLVMGNHIQTGVAAAGSVAAYRANRIRKHEHTRPDKEDDRVRQIEAVGAQTGPVFTAHPASPALDAVLGDVTPRPPAYSVTAEDGVSHTLWVVDAPPEVAAITAAFEAMPAIYIADGHHRSAAASRVAEARGEEDAGFLIVSFPDDEVQILDYNRVVKDLNGLSEDEFLDRIAKDFEVAPASRPVRPGAKRNFGMFLGARWYALTLKDAPGQGSPVENLDIRLLSSRLLEPVLGIGDARTDPRMGFIGGIRGLEELERLVGGGEFAVAFSLYPTGFDELMAVAEVGEVMPPKSTWFEPKLADGMVSLVLD